MKRLKIFFMPRRFAYRFDIADAQAGRDQERYRLAAWAAMTNFISTGVAVLALIITVPMTLPYLGEERFGVWMTVSSLAAMLSFLDFGVGNGLVNRIAIVNANHDRDELGFVITHGLIMLSVIGLAVGLLLIPVFLVVALGSNHQSVRRFSEGRGAYDADDLCADLCCKHTHQWHTKSVSGPATGLAGTFLQGGRLDYLFNYGVFFCAKTGRCSAVVAGDLRCADCHFITLDIIVSLAKVTHRQKNVRLRVESRIQIAGTNGGLVLLVADRNTHRLGSRFVNHFFLLGCGYGH